MERCVEAKSNRRRAAHAARVLCLWVIRCWHRVEYWSGGLWWDACPLRILDLGLAHIQTCVRPCVVLDVT